MIRHFYSVFLIVLLVLSVFTPPAFSMGGPPPPVGTGVGDSAADFSLPSLQGERKTFSDFRGKAVLLNFFSIYCPPCRWEMPSMQRLKERMAGRAFVVLAVNADVGDFEAVKKYISKNGYDFTVLYDFDGSVSARYMITSIPTTFIINKEGKIVKKVIGNEDWMDSYLVEEMEKLAR